LILEQGTSLPDASRDLRFMKWAKIQNIGYFLNQKSLLAVYLLQADGQG